MVCLIVRLPDSHPNQHANKYETPIVNNNAFFTVELLWIVNGRFSGRLYAENARSGPMWLPKPKKE